MRDQASYSRGRLKSSVGGRLFFLIPGKSYITSNFQTRPIAEVSEYPASLTLKYTIFSYPNTGIGYPKIKESFFMIFFSVRCIMRQFRGTLFEKKIVYVSQTSSPPPLPPPPSPLNTHYIIHLLDSFWYRKIAAIIS